MSFANARQNRTVTIGAVVTVHAALGYALLSGLAFKVVEQVKHGPLFVYNVKSPPPLPLPLEIRLVPKLDKVVPRRTETLSAPIPKVLTTGDGPLVIASIDEPGVILPPDPGPGPIVAPEPPIMPSLARGVAPRGNQGDWFPQDSYPAAARRANAQGRVSVRVSIGANGHITDCAVTASSGNEDLDATTCRLARRNGRFEPARDAEGAPVESSFTLRNVRWMLQ